MPTARELLEEADALMRRNRTHASDDIPLLTDSVPAGAEAQVLRGRGAAARAAAPVAPSPSVAEEGDSIPTLTERVPVADERPLAPTLDAATPAHAAPASGLVDAGGEPSDWLHREIGEPSITGEVPDSVLVAPSRHDLRAPRGHDPFEDSFLGAEPRASVAASEAEPPPLPPPSLDMSEEIEVVAPVSEAEDAFDAEFGAAKDPLPHEASVSVRHDAVAEPASFDDDGAFDEVDTVIDREALDEDDVAQASGFGDATSAADEAPAADEAHAVHEAQVLHEATVAHQATAIPEPPAVVAPTPAPPPPPAVEDDTRWEGVAEEIRMQVLQRIDIFTDTGLREQLSLRLQPIVDRASADLVATINQHVGELLRAYVAEAIEREIESWRRSH